MLLENKQNYSNFHQQKLQHQMKFDFQQNVENKENIPNNTTPKNFKVTKQFDAQKKKFPPKQLKTCFEKQIKKEINTLDKQQNQQNILQTNTNENVFSSQFSFIQENLSHLETQFEIYKMMSETNQEQLLNFMKMIKGVKVQLVNKKHIYQEHVLFLNPNSNSICWRNCNQLLPSKQQILPLTDIRYIKSPITKKMITSDEKKDKNQKKLQLRIISKSNLILNFIFSDEKQRDLWFKALIILLAQIQNQIRKSKANKICNFNYDFLKSQPKITTDFLSITLEKMNEMLIKLKDNQNNYIKKLKQQLFEKERDSCNLKDKKPNEIKNIKNFSEIKNLLHMINEIDCLKTSKIIKDKKLEKTQKTISIVQKEKIQLQRQIKEIKISDKIQAKKSKSYSELNNKQLSEEKQKEKCSNRNYKNKQKEIKSIISKDNTILKLTEILKNQSQQEQIPRILVDINNQQTEPDKLKLLNNDIKILQQENLQLQEIISLKDKEIVSLNNQLKREKIKSKIFLEVKSREIIQLKNQRKTKVPNISIKNVEKLKSSKFLIKKGDESKKSKILIKRQVRLIKKDQRKEKFNLETQLSLWLNVIYLMGLKLSQQTCDLKLDKKSFIQQLQIISKVIRKEYNTSKCFEKFTNDMQDSLTAISKSKNILEISTFIFNKLKTALKLEKTFDHNQQYISIQSILTNREENSTYRDTPQFKSYSPPDNNSKKFNELKPTPSFSQFQNTINNDQKTKWRLARKGYLNISSQKKNHQKSQRLEGFKKLRQIF